MWHLYLYRLIIFAITYMLVSRALFPKFLQAIHANRKNDLMIIMTPEKQDKTLELSKHWSVDSTPARNEVIMKRTYPVKSVNNRKRSHTQLDSRKQVIAFQDRVMTINIKEAQHPLKREKQVIDKSSIMLKISTKSMHQVLV